MISIKTSSNLNDYSYVQNGDVSIKSNTSTYKLNQSSEKSNYKDKSNNSPLFKKSNQTNLDLASLIFEDDKSNKLKT